MLLLKAAIFVTLTWAALANYSCPDYWTPHGKSCYRFFDSEKTFNDAEQHCLNEGTHLVSINDQDENDFVSWLTSCLNTGSRRGEKTWIGLGPNFHGMNPIQWTDGSAYTYDNWLHGEPNDDGSVEDCIEINYDVRGKWNDYNCNAKRFFVCEGASPVSRRASPSRRSPQRGRCGL